MTNFSYRIIARFQDQVLISGFPTQNSAEKYLKNHYMGNHWVNGGEYPVPLAIVEFNPFVKPYRDEQGNYVE